MHQNIDLKVLYFGTPVVLISTRNADGTANLAPMSSAWWLGEQCMLGWPGPGRYRKRQRRGYDCIKSIG